MTPLTAELSAIAGQAFAAEGFDSTFGAVQVSDRGDLAQFQCNGALAAGKLAKSPPRAIADRIAVRLRSEELFAKVEVAGPGFLNLDVTDDALARRVVAMTAEVGLGAPETGRN